MTREDYIKGLEELESSKNKICIVSSVLGMLLTVAFYALRVPFPAYVVPWAVMLLAAYWLGRTEECTWHRHRAMSLEIGKPIEIVGMIDCTDPKLKQLQQIMADRLRAACKPYIGNRNLTEDTIEEIRVMMMQVIADTSKELGFTTAPEFDITLGVQGSDPNTLTFRIERRS